MCGKGAAFPHHLPLFLSVVGKSLLGTPGAAGYLLGVWACQWLREQAAPSCAALSLVTGALPKQVLMVSL